VATWLATASATSYTLQRSAHGANVWTTVGSPTLPTFTDTVPGGGAYDYQVSATNAAGTSPYSTIATVTFPSLSLVGASAAANDSGSSLVTSLATTYAAATTTGNLLTCCVHEYSTPTLSNLTVTDNKGNTWTRATGISDGNLMCSAIFYTANATGGSNHIVTFHTSSGGIYMQMSIQEWANALSTAAPRGSGATATGTGTAVAAGSQSATAGDVVVGQMGGNFTAITITDAVGWTNLAHRDPVGLGVESDAEYIAAAANGNQNATWTLGSSHAWLACAQVFKPQT